MGRYSSQWLGLRGGILPAESEEDDRRCELEDEERAGLVRVPGNPCAVVAREGFPRLKRRALFAAPAAFAATALVWAGWAGATPRFAQAANRPESRGQGDLRVILATDAQEAGRSAPADQCGESQWPGRKNGITCGECKVLVDNFQVAYGTCQGYCQKLGRRCVGAWEEMLDTCGQAYEFGCNHSRVTVDAICQCAREVSSMYLGTAPTADVAPVIPHIYDEVQVERFLEYALPGDLLNIFRASNPMFRGIALHEEPSCLIPHPSVYFAEDREASSSRFENRDPSYPMASEYADTSGVAEPGPGQKQAVIGFPDLEWAYFDYNADLKSPSRYWVPAMDPHQSQAYLDKRKFNFVECSLLGWPKVASFVPAEFPLRVVLKNPTHGKRCDGTQKAWADCNLATSWYVEGEKGDPSAWRDTAKELNALAYLCSMKYVCSIRRIKFNSDSLGAEQLPQIFLFKALQRVDRTTTTSRQR